MSYLSFATNKNPAANREQEEEIIAESNKKPYSKQQVYHRTGVLHSCGVCVA